MWGSSPHPGSPVYTLLRGETLNKHGSTINIPAPNECPACGDLCSPRLLARTPHTPLALVRRRPRKDEGQGNAGACSSAVQDRLRCTRGKARRSSGRDGDYIGYVSFAGGKGGAKKERQTAETFPRGRDTTGTLTRQTRTDRGITPAEHGMSKVSLHSKGGSEIQTVPARRRFCGSSSPHSSPVSLIMIYTQNGQRISCRIPADWYHLSRVCFQLGPCLVKIEHAMYIVKFVRYSCLYQRSFRSSIKRLHAVDRMLVEGSEQNIIFRRKYSPIHFLPAAAYKKYLASALFYPAVLAKASMCSMPSLVGFIALVCEKPDV